MLHDHEGNHVLSFGSFGYNPVTDSAHRGTRRPTMYYVRFQHLHEQESQKFLVFSLVQAPSSTVRRRILIKSFRDCHTSLGDSDRHLTETSIDLNEFN